MTRSGKGFASANEALRMTREEFEQMWSADPALDGARRQELVDRYHNIILSHPISHVQLWRLEKVDQDLDRYAAMTAAKRRDPIFDTEQLRYVALMSTVLKYIHTSYYRRALSFDQTEAILQKGVKILTNAITAPAYAKHVLSERRDIQPSSYKALHATILMLDELRTIKPDAYDRLMQRNDIIHPGAAHRR